MSITTKTSAKGTTFTADGYNEFYRAYEQGAAKFTVFVPAATIAKMGLNEQTIHGFVRDVQDERGMAAAMGDVKPAAWTRGVRISDLGRVQ